MKWHMALTPAIGKSETCCAVLAMSSIVLFSAAFAPGA